MSLLFARNGAGSAARQMPVGSEEEASIRVLDKKASSGGAKIIQMPRQSEPKPVPKGAKLEPSSVIVRVNGQAMPAERAREALTSMNQSRRALAIHLGDAQKLQALGFFHVVDGSGGSVLSIRTPAEHDASLGHKFTVPGARWR